jgi:ABC-type Mn2+/Zn2+ transport system permease subunit
VLVDLHELSRQHADGTRPHALAAHHCALMALVSVTAVGAFDAVGSVLCSRR